MSNLALSLIIPVYNRPEQVRELLESLLNQSCSNFEVVIVEDGSDYTCEEVVKSFQARLNLIYYHNTRQGPGRTRNKGCTLATGNYFIFLDSDCLLPANYIATAYAELEKNFCDAFGGVDTAHASFSTFQKAVNHSMTSFWTTGGVRGKSESLGKFQPRSFNMGFSRQVWLATGGFSGLQYGEDIDLSLRIMDAGFRIRRIPELYVFHKRRTNLWLFSKQIFHFAQGRVRINKQYPKHRKLVYSLPALFVLGNIGLIILSFGISFKLLWLPIFYMLIVAIDAGCRQGINIALLAPIIAYTQLLSYGIGFLYETLLPPPPPKFSFPENTDGKRR